MDGLAIPVEPVALQQQCPPPNMNRISATYTREVFMNYVADSLATHLGIRIFRDVLREYRNDGLIAGKLSATRRLKRNVVWSLLAIFILILGILYANIYMTNSSVNIVQEVTQIEEIVIPFEEKEEEEKEHFSYESYESWDAYYNQIGKCEPMASSAGDTPYLDNPAKQNLALSRMKKAFVYFNESEHTKTFALTQSLIEGFSAEQGPRQMCACALSLSEMAEKPVILFNIKVADVEQSYRTIKERPLFLRDNRPKNVILPNKESIYGYSWNENTLKFSSFSYHAEHIVDIYSIDLCIRLLNQQ